MSGTDEQLRLLFADLQKKKEAAAQALQNNVFHNYPRFISTSKEIQGASLSHASDAATYARVDERSAPSMMA